MIKLYLFEKNVFTAIFFTRLSQQVIRNHISEMEKSTKMRFFMKVYTQVVGEIGHSEGKILGSKGPPGKPGGSVVECRTPEREVGGSKPTAAVLCP